MISANLTVCEIPSATEGEQERDEEWGWIALASSPSIGDYITVIHDLEIQIVRVERVIHQAIKIPPSKSGRQEPTLEIEAKWVTIDLSSYRTGPS